MKALTCTVVLLASMLFAQAFETGTVVAWEMKTYSQSAHIIRNQVVYSVRVGDTLYQIARQSEDLELSKGQEIQHRITGRKQ